MPTPEPRPRGPAPGLLPARRVLAILGVLLVAACAAGPDAPSPPARAPRLAASLPPAAWGQALDRAAAQAGDRHVFPDGRGLPPGRGSVAEGGRLYAAHCAACHGVDARGLTAEELVGGVGSLASAEPERTVGSYWPHAPTLFDFIRRAMPLHAPGSLRDDEVYALCAWLLHGSGLLPADAVLDASRLAALRMPNRDGFVQVGDPRAPEALPPR